MRAHFACLRCVLAMAIIVQPFMVSSTEAANPFEAVLDVVHNVKRRAGMNKPDATHVPSVERVAGEIDWLEHKVETFGTIVPKQPDVWGEARLTKYRRQVEVELAKRLDDFGATLQGSIRRSDQSLLTAALTLNAAAASPSPEGLSADEIAAFNSRTTALNEQTAAISTLAQATLTAGSADSIARTGPFAGTTIISPPAEGVTADPLKIAIEPTVFNDQLSRYLKALNQLRRINEGDDTSDSPGYSLNLVRIPVSVLPGKMTRKGYGAEVSLTAEPQITDDLLPSTMRSLIVNDVVNMHSLPVSQQLLNDPDQADKKLQAFAAEEVRVSRWMQGLDRWIEKLQDDARHLPPTENLNRTVAFMQSSRSYLENRFFQIAEAATKQESRSRLEASDFAIVETGKIHEDAAFPKLLGTFGVTFADLADWFDSIAKDQKSFACTHELKTYAVGGQRAAAAFLGDDRDVFVFAASAGLKQASKIKQDFSVWRSLPFTVTLPPTCACQTLARLNKLLTTNANPCGDFPEDACPCSESAPDSNEDAAEECDGVGATQPMLDFGAQLASGTAEEVPMSVDDEVTISPPPSGGFVNALEDANNEQRFTASISLRFDEVEKVTTEAFTAGYLNQVSNALDRVGTATLAAISPADIGALSTNLRTSRRPIPPSAFLPVVGYSDFLRVARDASRVLQRRVANEQVSTSLDIRAYLGEETNAAYDWLLDPHHRHLWDLIATPDVAEAIVDRNFGFLNRKRHEFIKQAGVETEATVVATLAWSILVNAALLNERLIEDMHRVSLEKRCTCLTGEHQTFVGPRDTLTAEAQASWKEYVSCRWPVQVFALDPVAEDQNIADQFSRRRELQLALAVGVAQGNVRANVASQFARRLETDIETIALNRVAVGFSHGNDTFGWRFYPRLQSPDTPGTVGAFWETLAGGPDRDADLRDRGLEPGIRECTAIVVMPSFIPHVTIDSRASWFSLTNPRRKALTMKDTMKISRNYQAVRRSLSCAHENCAYRPGDVAQLTRVVDQIERRLPLQNMLVPVPFENTLGGFEMFQAGITDLAPELYGWYGAPGVKIASAPTAKTTTETDITAGKNTVKTVVEADASSAPSDTTLFLVGSRFSVHETEVIAGGKPCTPTLLSREIMKVIIPGNVNTVTHPLADGTTQDYVDVHVATPYGVTNHLLVRAITPKSTASAVATASLVSDATSKVSSLEKTVQQMQRNLPEVVGSAATLNLVATPQDDGTLSIEPALGVAAIELTAENHFGATMQGIVEVALFDEAKKDYVTNRISTGYAVDFTGTSTGTFPEKKRVRLDAAELAKHLPGAFVGKFAASDFKDNKKEFVAVLFLSPGPRGTTNAVVRVLGEVKVALTLNPKLTASTSVSNVERIAAGYIPRRLPAPRMASRQSVSALR